MARVNPRTTLRVSGSDAVAQFCGHSTTVPRNSCQAARHTCDEAEGGEGIAGRLSFLVKTYARLPA